MDTYPLGLTPIDGIAGQLLNSVQRLAPAADNGAQALTLEHNLVVTLAGDEYLRTGFYLEVFHQAGKEGSDLIGPLIIGRRRVYRNRLLRFNGRTGRTNQHLVPFSQPGIPAGTVPAFRPVLSDHTGFSGQNSLFLRRNNGGLNVL